MSQDPIRLFGDPSVPPGLREDLRRAAQGAEHSYDLEKGLARFRAAIAATPILGPGPDAGGLVGAAGTAAPVAATKAAVGLVGKLGIVGVTALVGAAGVTTYLYRAAPDQTPARILAPIQQPVLPIVVEREEPEVEAPPAVPAPLAVPEPVERRVKSIRRRPNAKPSSVDDAVQREIAVVARARTVLETNPVQALALTVQGERDFPTGVLGQERQAIAVFALARLQRWEEARIRGKEFLARYPQGPFSERVRRTLARE